MKGLSLSAPLLFASKQVEYVDHFVNKDTTFWTTTVPDLGTASMTDAAGGIIQLSPSDGTVADNDEAYLLSTNEVVRVLANRPLHLECLLQFSEAATNAANVVFGCANAVAANFLADNGAGLPANFSGAAFYKVDGSTLWRVIYSDGTTQTIAELNASTSLRKQQSVAGSASYQLLEIDIIPKTTTLVDVIFQINGSTVFKMLDRTYASSTEANVVVGVKNGTAAQQALNVDMIAFAQRV